MVNRTAVRTTLSLLLATAIVLLPLSALASDLTGIYVAQSNGTVAFFNLTDQDGALTGYYQVVASDQSSSDGVRRNNFNVSGSLRGSRAVLTVGPSYRWTADVGWNGFTASVPMNSGQISEVFYRRSSVAEVNRLVASITSSGNTAKYYSNTQAELADSETRLSNDVNTYRPRILGAAETSERESKASRPESYCPTETCGSRCRQEIRTHGRRTHASLEMESDATIADSNVTIATSDLQIAGWNVDSAQRDLQSAENDLVKMDARIAQLRGIISRDKAILHAP